MIQVEIPGRQDVKVEHLVLDYNGTVAKDGELIDGVAERLLELKELVDVHILTADTYGTARKQCEPLGVFVDTFPRANAAECKVEIVRNLKENRMCIGNGFNDVLMFDEAEFAVAVLEEEGTYAGLLSHADVVTKGIVDALDLLLKPNRLKATLRT
ncbi:MAG: ATPase P [Lachnospiraceae bacterium]|nr:ATPase P [Lachnospiraceae bacterium]